MPPDPEGSSRLWWAAFVALSLALVLPLWLVSYPPGVDLPQHGAQVAIGLHWFDDGLPYRHYYELNLLAHQVVAYSLVGLFSLAIGVVPAIKLVLSLALVGVPLASLRLVRAAGGDRWWVFATFPVAYSFSFFWGFLNFVVAIPLALLLVAAAVAHVRRPTRRGLVALALLPLLVFVGHVLALVYAGLASAAVIFVGLRGRDRVLALAALAAVVPVIGAWFVGTQMAAPSSTGIPTILGYGLGRVTELPNQLVGIPRDLSYTALGLLALVAPFLAGARPARFGWRWAPVLAALFLYLAVPHDVMGTAFLYPRYAVFIVPALLLALRPGPGLGRDGRLGRGLGVTLAAAASVAMSFRFAAYQAESESFAGVVGHVEPGSRVLGLSYDVGSAAIPYPVYLHWVCWLQVEDQAVADFSFAEFFPNRFRYRPGLDPDLPDHIEWTPRSFRWAKNGGADYDYFLVRRPELARRNPFAGATTKLELVSEGKPWSLVRQR